MVVLGDEVIELVCPEFPLESLKADTRFYSVSKNDRQVWVEKVRKKIQTLGDVVVSSASIDEHHFSINCFLMGEMGVRTTLKYPRIVISSKTGFLLHLDLRRPQVGKFLKTTLSGKNLSIPLEISWFKQIQSNSGIVNRYFRWADLKGFGNSRTPEMSAYKLEDLALQRLVGVYGREKSEIYQHLLVEEPFYHKQESFGHTKFSEDGFQQKYVEKLVGPNWSIFTEGKWLEGSLVEPSEPVRILKKLDSTFAVADNGWFERCTRTDEPGLYEIRGRWYKFAPKGV
jgi:hypothetical protein